MKSSRERIEALTEALDEAPTEEEAKATVEALGIDVKGLARELRRKVETADRRQRFDAARAAYAKEVERLELRKSEPMRTRDEHYVVLRGLLAKAPPEALSMHFLKYETATDEELAELIRSLRELLGEDEG